MKGANTSADMKLLIDECLSEALTNRTVCADNRTQ